jgi:hypothetical protein
MQSGLRRDPDSEGSGLMGRPTSLTPEVADKVVSAIRSGAYTEVAAQYAGVAQSTFFLWKAKGKRDLEEREAGDYPSIAHADEDHKHEWSLDDGKCWCGHTRYSEFLERIKEAEASSEMHAVLKVRAAFDDNWQAAMTYLERRYPQRWRRRSSVEVDDKPAEREPEAAEVEMPATERLARVLAVLESAGQTDE